MVESQIQKVQKYFAETIWDYKIFWTGKKDLGIHYGYYDTFAKTHSKAVLQMNQIMADLAQITPKDVVLDSGCGYCGSAMWLAKNRGCKVKGVTIVPQQASVAKKAILKRGLQSQVEVLVEDFSQTTFLGGSFDVYWAQESLVQAENREKVLLEAIRVLKPGGRIILSEYMYRENPPITIEERNYMDVWLKGWAMSDFFTETQYQEMLKRLGFKEVKIYDITEHIKSSANRMKLMSKMALSSAEVLGYWGVFSEERVSNVAATLRQAQALERGLWSYKLVLAKKSPI